MRTLNTGCMSHLCYHQLPAADAAGVQTCPGPTDLDGELTFALHSILSTNRDEFLARPTSAAAWRDGSLETVGAQQGVMGEVLGGRDEVGGGMWFGMNNRGRVGIL